MSADRARNAGADFAIFRFALCLLIVVPLALAGCSGATRRVSVERASVERDASVDASKSSAPAPRSSRGGYYQDDGPGDNVPANLDQIEDAEPRLEPLHRFANNPYTVFGQSYVPYRSLASYRERGVGSWYGRKFHGQRTSSGETYDMYAMTAAHPTLPIPSYARVSSLANGRSVIVRVNDRGPFFAERLIDLSFAAANRLGYSGAGSALVEVEAITPEEIPVLAARRGQAGAAATAVAPQPTIEARTSVLLMAAAAEQFGLDAGKQVPSIPVDAEANGIYLQLGAFSGRDNAENFRVRVYQQLAWLSDGLQMNAQDGLFRLHLGPYRNRTEADAMAEKIRAELKFKPLVVGK